MIQTIKDGIGGWFDLNRFVHTRAYRLASKQAGEIKKITFGFLISSSYLMILSFGANLSAILYPPLGGLVTAIILIVLNLTILTIGIISFGKKRLGSSIVIFLIATAIFSIFLMVFAPLVDKTKITNILLLIGIASAGGAYFLLGTIKEGVTITWLLAMIYRTVTIDIQLEVLQRTWQELSKIVKWLAANIKAGVRLGFSAIPGATLEEVEAALSEFPELKRLEMVKLFGNFTKELAKLVVKINSYGRSLQTWFHRLFAFQIVYLAANSMCKFGNAKFTFFNQGLVFGFIILILLVISINAIGLVERSQQS